MNTSIARTESIGEAYGSSLLPSRSTIAVYDVVAIVLSIIQADRDVCRVDADRTRTVSTVRHPPARCPMPGRLARCIVRGTAPRTAKHARHALCRLADLWHR
jgi:hypothetical protein